MHEYYKVLIEQIVDSSSGIMPIIVIGVSLFVHLYYLVLKDRRNTRQMEHERQVAQKEYDSQMNSEILAVVKENTSAITQNTAVSSSLKVLCESMSMDIKASVCRTHDVIGGVLKDTSEIKTMLKTKCRGDIQ